MNKIPCILLLLIILTISSCSSPEKKKTLRIIHAGSMALVVKDITEAYTKENPDITILSEAWGSKDGARQITELNKPCDVYISADYSLIESFLMPEYASWGIPFAGNEMVLAYKAGSKYQAQINSENWYRILSQKDVLTARSSPDSDPCGVRSVLLMMLADNFYHDSAISQKLLAKDVEYIRPKEADLIALLEKNTVDYLYIYKSIAVQHGFLYLELPDEINLCNPQLQDVYKRVSFETLGKTPDSKHLEVGSAILYGITIPLNAPNADGAADFISFFLNPEKGGKIIEKNGQNLLSLQKIKNFDKVPPKLKGFVMPL